MKRTTLILIAFLFLFQVKSFSEEVLKRNTDGGVTFVIEKIDKNFFIGLTPPFRGEDVTSNTAYSFLVISGQVHVLEYGKLMTSVGSVVVGDSLSIKREGSIIKYYKNDLNIRSTNTKPDYELMIVHTGEDIPKIETKIPEKLEAFAYISSITANDQNNNTGIIDVNPQGGEAPYTYKWETGETTKYINNLEPGTYRVNIEDAQGNNIELEYSISYIVTAMVPNTFIKENNLIVKHNSSIDDFEVMISENIVQGNTSVEASFKEINEGDPISFVFGLDSKSDDFENGKELDYSIMTIQNQMYFTENGNVISELGEYLSSQTIKLKIKENNQLEVYLDNIQLIRHSIESNAYRSKIALTKLEGGLIKWTTPSFWTYNAENDFYASLTKKLDGSFYKMKNYIKFKYKEKYNDNELNYKVYDWQRNIKMEDVGVSNHKYGINYNKIPAFSQLVTDEYYTLEVTNSKGEIYKMRFSFEKVGVNGVVIIDYVDQFDPNTRCCYTRPATCSCAPGVVAPNNPILIYSPL